MPSTSSAIARLPRRWDIKAGDDGRWRGTIYGPDGETPSLNTPLLADKESVYAVLAEQLQWLEAPG